MAALHDECLWADGVRVDAATLAAWRRGKSGLAADLADFLEQWYSEAPTMELHTSGSTGAPQCIRASKAAMRASAMLSCRVFGLSCGSSALLCLPLRYIAGKMMVVRALVAGLHLHLVEPSSTPFAGLTEKLDFAPVVPMQAIRTLAGPGGAERLALVGTLLLGGAFVDTPLEIALQALPCRVFASYGMTETLSHVALRTLTGPDRSDFYTPLPGVQVALSPAGTLRLTVPHLNVSGLETNDLAELRPDGAFRILGRRDAVINSGGVKIQAERVEAILRERTGLTLLALPAPHAVLGQCVAIVWEGAPAAESALRLASESLPRHHRPHLLRHVDAIPRTATGKLSRHLALRLLYCSGSLPSCPQIDFVHSAKLCTD